MLRSHCEEHFLRHSREGGNPETGPRIESGVTVSFW